MKELHYNVTGQDRKEMVGVISKVIGMKAVYKFMPTCAFVISNITVEKDGTMVWDERTDQDTIEAVIIALAAAGFNPAKDEDEAEETGLTVEIPLEHVQVGNLLKLLDAKGSLIKKALGTDDIGIEGKQDRVAFPWFSTLPEPDEIKAYSHFITALCKLAKDAKRTGRLAYFGPITEAREFFGKEKMEEIVKSVNRQEEGGEGRADEFILKFAEVQHG